ncbi:hypothetical protein CEUSTIGMA_g3089.t1 [Chlamydomonas eustigma]|uniref:Uncharacterized protein n=1 Tax=Chlamydomonas eustigma TaxID=1157962 RepID=A0A250WXY4_9CHLO|nr:hypothetical protein CEUSTIGMA_g3089.t1 [Chlamydomonas eustigma]|eukprot:GAX75645.1 hypothetical protein CEUSTIGMA_g3089.t1 [Chlamydomonas eustigma]
MAWSGSQLQRSVRLSTGYSVIRKIVHNKIVHLPSLMNEISQESYPTLLQKAINHVGPQKYSKISKSMEYLNNPISSSPHLEGLETSNLGLVQRLHVGKENIKGVGEKEGIWQRQREEGGVLSVHNNKLKSE